MSGLIFVTAGLLLVALGAAGRFWWVQPEKEALYFLGHWFDVFWELQLPLWVAGGALIILGLLNIYRYARFPHRGTPGR